ncbi:LuxR C-terminal-related transcriptional regulator [Streptomyces sp. FXJ1.172]|uniref:helix-turn-helix transcriptional regulator n=1 Tax=Streptomyces sp. FXJ1.172 TaxID=710705 RepID=UPI0007CF8EC0|nr:LuxR family transcriptional regulator [Streptomyces sp. FXJ1.172]ANR02561.1 LodR3 [Streptomyces sp.]WEO99628.1 LuxR C-terminal-related transcriptional regulator [Streptomyces sp. FXJ1.172]
MSGDSRTVLIEAGVACGKSTALEGIGEYAAARGALILHAAGSLSGSSTPLGVVRQLIDCRSFPERAREGILATLGQGNYGQFGAIVRNLAVRIPVVVSVDDLHHVDVESLHCLLHLVGHTRKSRILTLFTQSLSRVPQDPTFDTELLRQPNFRRVRLSPLSLVGVAGMLSAHPDVEADAELTSDLHAASGGNPLLLRALVEDHLAARWFPGTSGERAEPGVSFSRAVLTCLHRGGTRMRDAAAALAVLGESEYRELLGPLAGLSANDLVQAQHALDGAGITENRRFRHCLARAAVLNSLTHADRRALHLRAAALLHRQGASVGEVAAHLLAGGDTVDTWGVTALKGAAEEALAADRAREAIACLELAHAGCTDARTRAEITVRLACVAWRINPATAEDPYLSQSLSALWSGLLPAPFITPLANLLIANGRLDEARHALGRLQELAGPGRALPTDTEIMHPWEWDVHFPLHDVPQAQARDARLPSLHPGRPDPASPAVIERFLQVSPLTDTTLTAVITAIKSLIHHDRVDLAENWCDAFLVEARRRCAPGWEVLFASLRAEIALHQGRLTHAALFAGQALEAVPEHSGPFFIGGPISSLVLAHTAMGDYESAARRLNQSVPEALFKNVYGLRYLRARGRYYLASNRAHAALGDFLDAGRLAVRWGVDRPALLPWRTDAAEAWLDLGEPEQAERLINDQLQMRDAVNSRVRGVALRLRAMTVDAKLRPRLLTKAVEAIQASGDRLEMARVLDALGDAQQALGDATRAAAAKRRARHMARECGATAWAGARYGVPAQAGPAQQRWPAERPAAPSAAGKLSESERRVAALAACGYTNRDISTKLYITVSTVEQHLTRVYRKLEITRREQLPPDLQFSLHENDCQSIAT